MQKETEECLGCTMESICSIDLNYLKNNNLICPCSTCLVKMVCQKMCSRYVKFVLQNPDIFLVCKQKMKEKIKKEA